MKRGRTRIPDFEPTRQHPVRLLETNKVTPEDLRAARQPRLTQCEKIVLTTAEAGPSQPPATKPHRKRTNTRKVK